MNQLKNTSTKGMIITKTIVFFLWEKEGGKGVRGVN